MRVVWCDSDKFSDVFNVMGKKMSSRREEKSGRLGIEKMNQSETMKQLENGLMSVG